jgi:hypothetical protein
MPKVIEGHELNCAIQLVASYKQHIPQSQRNE